MLDVRRFKHIAAAYWNAQQIQSFIGKMEYKPCKVDEEGTSWPELYTLFKMAGGGCMVENAEGSAEARPSMRVQIKRFQMACRDIVKHTMTAEDAECFKPSAYKKARLKSLGIISHMAMVRLKVVIRSEARQELAFHIL
eukprot:11548322-Karenia_brevis.AAC.1